MPQRRAGSSGLCVTSSHGGNGVQTDHKQGRICLLHVFLVCSGNKAQHGGIVFPRNTTCLVLLGARGEENLSRVMGGLIHEPLRLCRLRRKDSELHMGQEGPRAGEQPLPQQDHQCPRWGLAFSRLILSLSRLPPPPGVSSTCMFLWGDVIQSLTLVTIAHGDSYFSAFKPLERSHGLPLNKNAPSIATSVIRPTLISGWPPMGSPRGQRGGRRWGQLNLPGHHLHQLLVATGSRSHPLCSAIPCPLCPRHSHPLSPFL